VVPERPPTSRYCCRRDALFLANIVPHVGTWVSSPAARRPPLRLRSRGRGQRPSYPLRGWSTPRTSSPGDICDKDDPGCVAAGLPQPPRHLAAAARKHCPKHGLVPVNCPPCRVRVGKNEHPSNGHRVPPEPLPAHDSADEPHLLVCLPAERLHRCQFRLHLLDHDRPGRTVGTEHIDRSPLPIDRVGGLDDHVPSQSGQATDGRRHQGRAALVEQPIEAAATPEHDALETGVERGKDPPQLVNADLRRVAPLDERLWYASRLRQILLPPPPSAAQFAQDPSDPRIVHPTIIDRRDYSRLTGVRRTTGRG